MRQILKRLMAFLFSTKSVPLIDDSLVGRPAVSVGLDKSLPALEQCSPNWQQLIDDSPSVWSANTGVQEVQKILIATGIGGHEAVTAIEGLLAAALKIRSAEVHLLLCDGVLPACLMCCCYDFPESLDFAKNGPAIKICGKCTDAGKTAYSGLNLQVHNFSDFLTAQDFGQAQALAASVEKSDIDSFSIDGVQVGEHVRAGVIRYFLSSDIAAEPDAEKVTRRYFEAGLLSLSVIKNILKSIQFDCVVMNHGIYVPHGVMAEFLRRVKVRVVTWAIPYRKGCLSFAHDDSEVRTLITESPSLWEDIQWGAKQEGQLLNYLKSRAVGTNDWFVFHDHSQGDMNELASEFKIDFDKPIVGLLTNVVWDAGVNFASVAFKDMMDWLVKTIRYFSKRQDIQLVIRIHPAEVRGGNPSRQLAWTEIQKEFPQLPENVFVIPPEHKANTYALIARCNCALIFGTIMGMELTSVGIPVIVAGQAWIQNKGITIDTYSEAEYFSALDALPLSRSRVGGQLLLRAQKYAYHFFFRRMIPLKSIQPVDGWPPFRLKVESLETLRSGTDLGLDVICDGILQGSEFIYPAEVV